MAILLVERAKTCPASRLCDDEIGYTTDRSVVEPTFEANATQRSVTVCNTYAKPEVETALMPFGGQITDYVRISTAIRTA